MKLIVDEKEFTNFYSAIQFLEWQYGFAGEAWYRVIEGQSFKELADFLSNDGIHADLELTNV